ncbi:serine hydrolase domain-containing protein [Variovorax paradoxus]|uniref:6-aminohexanoate-dimer hydrolase n=1 Tax=Variovorax paradoxus TaxID=34073 RepID=A0A0H2LTX8_VARPD|nr:serine hydrolase [Variovorax paradoxus]KLN53679.1 6-aminohexanoate-dimer hydrolase [Variovorax paradoxus]
MLFLLAAFVPMTQAQRPAEWRNASAAEQAQDTVAFAGIDQAIREDSPDVQSAVVVWQGRVVYQFYRDGSPDTLRNVHSVSKSALSTLTGIALGQGHLASLDERIVSLVPEWAGLNPDPRAAAITVRHLLTMTAGFEVNDPTGTATAGHPQDMWKRPMRDDPGRAFAYDNALIPMLSVVLERATGMSVPDYARRHLVGPLALGEPSYQQGLSMRTLDMAKLGQLYLQNGVWAGQQILPEAYVHDATRPQSAGGLPLSLPYGYMWWVVRSNAVRPTFMAAGYGGQFVWVYPPLDLVMATTSAVSRESLQRFQAMKLIRGRLFAAAQQRAKEPSR